MKAIDDDEPFIELRDPQEEDPQLYAIIKSAEHQAIEELRQEEFNNQVWGYCRVVWDRQQHILKEKHGIDWKTPVELNPNILYD